MPSNSQPSVIVVGLGGMGSAAAHHLAARGCRVTGLERHTPAHDLGSSHGGSRVVRQAYFEDPAYVPLLLRAYELWEALGRDAEADVFRMTGGLFVGAPETETVSGSLRAAQEWGLDHELLDAAQIRTRFPTFAPQDHEVGLYEAKAGFARPEATVAAQLHLAAGLGADLHFTEPVLEWGSTPGGGAWARTAVTTYTADQLVVCPGAWAPQLLADLGVPIEIERQVMHWFAPPGGVEPFVEHPVYIHETAGGSQVYGFPAYEGPDGGAKIAFFRKGSVCTPETIDRTVTSEEVDTMRARATQILPGLDGPGIKAATCMYSTTPDHHFVIARHPAHESVTVACGFSGHGFKFVPVVGEVLADLATTGTTRHPIGLFDPARFAGAPAPAAVDTASAAMATVPA